MTATTVDPVTVAGRAAQDGWEFMSDARALGWRPLSVWGSRGWDLGQWPYVVVVTRNTVVSTRPLRFSFDVAVYTEGDVVVHEHPTQQARADWIDGFAIADWRLRGAPHVDQVPADELTGPWNPDRWAVST